MGIFLYFSVSHHSFIFFPIYVQLVEKLIVAQVYFSVAVRAVYYGMVVIIYLVKVLFTKFVCHALFITFGTTYIPHLCSLLVVSPHSVSFGSKGISCSNCYLSKSSRLTLNPLAFNLARNSFTNFISSFLSV